MSSKIKKYLGLVLPLVIGLGIIYYQYTTLKSDELTAIKSSFLKANYFYVLISLIVAFFGFWSRAYRWKYTLNHLGYQTKFHNDFFAVCISYLVNLTIPRSGEISRAAILKKHENIPFDKAFGTIVAERIVDFLIFLLFVGIAFLLQFNKLYGFLSSKIALGKLIALGILLIVLGVFFILVWIYAEWPIILKLKNKLSGLLEGISSIVSMKKKWKYLLHSFLIWISYLIMFYVTIFALPETANISFDVVLMGFIFGTLAVGFTNGGLGAYPLAVAMIFKIFGVSNEIGTAFGWLTWTSQTLFTIFLGLISYLLLPIYNKK